MQTLPGFHIIGIAVRTTNENGQSGKDIPQLWERFQKENIAAHIPNKIDPTIYCVYTDYEKDHTRPYTTLLGYKVPHLDTIPQGLTGHSIAPANYVQHVAKGNIFQGAVYEAWQYIWNANLDRAFTADFEVYGEKAQNPESAEVDIFIAIR